jgi:hypothetical protein
VTSPSPTSIVAALCALALHVGAGSAAAQDASPKRLAVTLTAGYLMPATSFTQSVTFEQYSEEGSITSVYNAASRPSFDGAITLRVWRGLGVGVAGTYFHDPGVAQVSAMVPHPLVPGQPRQISGPASVKHTETAVHVQAAYWFQAAPRMTVIVTGGPSFFNVSQDFVSDVAYTQSFPYTTATYQGATTTRERKSATGYNIAGEAGWRVWGKLSVVGAARYSRATASFTDALDQPITLGGLHVGAGIRLIF